MKFLSEVTKEFVVMETDMTEEERDMLLSHGKRKLNEGNKEAEDALIEYVIIKSLEELAKDAES